MAERATATATHARLIPVLLGVILLAGCGGKTPSPEPEGKAAPANPGVGADAPSQAAGNGDPRLTQPFAEATLADPPDGQELPDQTMTGKSVGKLYTQVAACWEKISFAAASGKAISYRAILKTDLGDIEIALRPDLAPNHVRNFVALARAGYYDGLVFERTVHEESEAEPGQILEFVEAGCPVGTGEANYGSIGYWLRPELSDRVQHEPGTVGAWHVEEADTAACKFYITLTRAPIMDGNWTVFGRVVKGLDAVRTIHQKPVRPDEFKDRPENPVVIRKVTIMTQEE